MSTFKKYFLLIAILISVSLASISVSTLSAAEDAQIEPIQIKNPGTDLWRAVRQRNQEVEGKTQIKSLKAGTLIDNKGYLWRQFRSQWLLPYGGYFILGVLALLLLLKIIIRKVRIPGGRSGKKVTRMSIMQRIAHWFLVSIVTFMALTGLILLFGRIVFIPYIGAEGFSPIASASKEGHNLFGPLLVIALLMMLVYFIRYNWPAKVDFKWLVTLGGLLSRKHLKVGFFNAGEKMLYWAVILLGIALSITGLILLFPFLELEAKWLQVVIAIHAIAALLLIGAAFAHIWMVVTLEGTIDAMTQGEVDENWAKAHHSLWYEELQQHQSTGATTSKKQEPTSVAVTQEKTV